MPILNEQGYLTGPTIRLWEMARALHRSGLTVTLADPGLTHPVHKQDLPVVPWSFRSISELAGGFHACLLGHYMAGKLVGKLKHTRAVVDFFDPEYFALAGSLNLFRRKRKQIRRLKSIRRHMQAGVRLGAYFLCANQRQYDWLAGMLTAEGRLDRLVRADLPIGIVPTGTPPEDVPESGEVRLRGVLTPKQSKIVLWPGGLYPWFDGMTPLRALRACLRHVPETVLVYWGARNPVSPEFSRNGYRQVRHAAREWGWLNRKVFFVDWLPYEQRGIMYSQADLGVLCYHPSLETHYSFRTRMVDCLWGGLPLLTTGGDTVSRLIQEYRAGRILEGDTDVETWAAAMAEILRRPDQLKEMGSRARLLARKELSWDRSVLPLVHWLRSLEEERSARTSPRTESLPNPPFPAAAARAWTAAARRFRDLSSRLKSLFKRS